MKRIVLLTMSMVIMGVSMAQQSLHWTPGNYLNNMTVVGIITIDGVEQTLTTLEVGAFCGEECRGSICPSFFPPTQQYIATMTIGSDGTSGEVITFRLYDHSISQELDLECTASVTFLSDDRIGEPGNWYQFSYVTPEVTYTLPITGYGTSTSGYYLIAPPIDDVNPAEIVGMTEGDYDLYYFDQGEELEWRNYEANPFNLESGIGYLYAHNTDVTLAFSGTPYSGDGTVSLVKTPGADFEGWNLVGNPFPSDASVPVDFYRMNAVGSAIIASDNSTVNMMEGIFVVAASDGATLTFTPVSKSAFENPAQLVVNVSHENSGIVIDRAIVRMGSDNSLPKLRLLGDGVEIYIPQNGKDYAIVGNEGISEMPLNFKVTNNGNYTLNVELVSLEMDYLHLIDNITGTDINLLSTPCYSFNAKTTDYECRFKLVFSANGIEEHEAENSFAYLNGEEIVITEYKANALLQVVDMMGRILVCRDASNASTISTNGLTAGMYVLRLIDGNDVKTQKVVIP